MAKSLMESIVEKMTDEEGLFQGGEQGRAFGRIRDLFGGGGAHDTIDKEIRGFSPKPPKKRPDMGWTMDRWRRKFPPESDITDQIFNQTLGAKLLAENESFTSDDYAKAIEMYGTDENSSIRQSSSRLVDMLGSILAEDKPWLTEGPDDWEHEDGNWAEFIRNWRLTPPSHFGEDDWEEGLSLEEIQAGWDEVGKGRRPGDVTDIVQLVDILARTTPHDRVVAENKLGVYDPHDQYYLSRDNIRYDKDSRKYVRDENYSREEEEAANYEKLREQRALEALLKLEQSPEFIGPKRETY